MLNESRNELHRILGEEAFAAFCDRWGGRDYDIPRVKAGDKWRALVSVVGAAGAARLHAWGAGGRVYVPYRHACMLDRRRAVLRELAAAGLSPASIAKCYRFESRLTARQVTTLLNEAEG